MEAIVVFESHWGNTAAVAKAIAEGIGPDARALATDEATPDAIGHAELVVAGAPLMGLRLPTDKIVADIHPGEDAPAPDLSHPTLRAWLDRLPPGHAAYAAFETKLHWSPGGATGTIEKGLDAAGYRQVSRGRKFIVKGTTGPLREGELDKARAWGAELAASTRSGNDRSGRL